MARKRGSKAPAAMADIRLAARRKASGVARKRGPKTPAGKQVVSRNAVKDGFYALDPVIEGLESWDEWRAFHDEMVESLQPLDAYHRFLASKMAETMWRWRRVGRAEADAVERSMVDIAETRRLVARIRRLSLSDDDARDLGPLSERGLALLRGLDGLDDDAPLDLRVVSAVLCSMVDDDDGGLIDDLPAPPPDPSTGEPRLNVAAFHEAVAALAARKAASVGRLLDEAEKRLANVADTAIGQLASGAPAFKRRYLPSERDHANILRADAHLRRQLTRLENLFEAHAARIGGDPLPLVRVQHLGSA